MRIFFISFIILITLSILTNCGRKEYTEKGIEEIKQEIDSILYTAEPHMFDWGSSKAYSNFRAYFNNSHLIFINEDYHYRKPGEAFNRYYYKDGKMIFFIGKQQTYFGDGNGKQKKELQNLTMYVDPDENVISYNKIVNGKRLSLDQEEAEQIINHANEIRTVVESRLAKK